MSQVSTYIMKRTRYFW